MECLDADQVFAFVAGDLGEEAREAVEIHIDECDGCRQMLAEAARRERVKKPEPADIATEPTVVDDGSPRSSGDAYYPPAGTLIDRYRVERFLGAGGMGVVMRASDDELDRMVTIKLLRPELADPDDTRGARARLLREAQAMARLSHPNVVPIYDIGTWNEQVFIAMEYLDGGTLATRLDRGPEPGEVIELFAAAGRGLAAAHAARLIHRDFKPANVMLSKTGAVKVTDFGLALPGASGPARTRRRSAEIAVPAEPASLTRTGLIVGTPAYMPPEQMRGESVDVRSDIFSFSVALHEGLFGSRPFDGSNTDELLTATLQRAIQPPARDPKLPDRIRQIVARGLEPNPDDRPSSMAEVLAALAPRRRGKWPLIAALAAILATSAIIAAALGWVRAGDEPLELIATTCSSGPERFAPSWSDAIASEVRSAIARAPGVAAPELITRTVVRRLDRYRDEWVGVHRAACTATRLAGDQSVELMEAQMACLERRREELDRVVDGIRMGSTEAALTAETMVATLTSPRVCTSAAAMAREPPRPSDAAAQKEVAAIRAEIGKALASSTGGDLDGAITAATAATERARAIGFAPVEAEAWLVKGKIELVASKYDESLASFRETLQIAQLANHDQARADAYVGIIDLQIRRARLDEAERWLRYAREALAKVAENLGAEAALATRSAEINRARGDISAALADGKRAVELQRELHGDRSPELARALMTLASLQYNAASDPEAAIPLYREAESMLTELYGDADARLIEVLTGLTAALSGAGRNAEALAVADRRQPLVVAALGAKNPMLASLSAQRARILAELGRRDEAMVELDAAVTGAIDVFGEGSREHIDNLMSRALAHFKADDFARARIDIAAAVAMTDKLFGPTSETALIYRNLLGTVLTKEGDLAAARAELERNVANGERTLEPDAPLLADALSRLAKAERLAGETAAARGRLERALEMLSRQPDSGIDAFARWQLGQAIGSGPRAVELVRAARPYYASPRGDPRELTRIDAWLARAGD